MLRARCGGEIGRRQPQLKAAHQPLAAHLFNDVAVMIPQRRKFLSHQQPERGDAFNKAGRQDDIHHGIADRHRQRIAAEGGAVRADRHSFGGLGRRQASAHRKAAADAFGDAHNIGGDAGVLMGK